MRNDPKLDKLKSDLSALQSSKKATQDKRDQKLNDTESMTVGLRAGAELITSIAAGGLIGYALDSWLGTKPIFLIALLILGVITGFVNVWRTTNKIGYQVGLKDVEKDLERNKKETK